MWPNNGFGNNGAFQNNFNRDDTTPSPFTGSPGFGPYFPQQPLNGNTMPYEPGGNGFNKFQPEVGMFNESAYLQNRHFMNPNSEFPPAKFNAPRTTAPTPPRAAIINARAAELKLQLLKGKEARGATPKPTTDIPGLASKPVNTAEPSSSLHTSPKTPLARAEGNEQDLNALISQYSSETKPPTISTTKKENINPNKSISQALLPTSSIIAKPQDPSLISPTKVTKPSTNGILAQDINGNEQQEEMSEGEILDEPEPEKELQPRESSKAKQNPAVSIPTEQSVRKAREELPPKSSSRNLRENVLPHRIAPSNPKTQGQRSREAWREEADARQDKRPQSDHRQARRPYPESIHGNYSRRGSRDDDYRRPEPRFDEKREERPRELKTPTLEQLLPLDADLREWLDITGYHNAPYRDKILSRRRAIAALDAQREKLLAEMQEDERGGIPIIPGPRVQTPSMFPSADPNQASGRPEKGLANPNAANESQRDRLNFNKRTFSEAHDTPMDDVSGKIARTDSDSQRIKLEEDSGFRGRRSSFDRREDKEPRSRYEDNRGEDRLRGRGSRERSMSPGRRAYESRPPARTRSYETHEFRDIDAADRGSRLFDGRGGGYKGRAFDPNYRGRGRGGGRGRTEIQSYSDSRIEAFGSKVASKPFKGEGFNRGGKGGA